MVRRDTRELILATSLALFNEQGEPNVTTNQIAIEADISPGNLYYHFRNKNDIVLELFKRYLLGVHPALEDASDGAVEVEDLWLRLHLVFEAMGRFRFLFRNLPDLYARIPNLRHAFHGLLARQRAMLAAMIDGLRERQLMTISEHESDLLADNILLSMTHWISFAEVRGDPGLSDGRAQTQAVARVLHMVLPYLGPTEAEHLEALAHRYREP